MEEMGELQNEARFRAIVEHIPGVALYMDEVIDDDPRYWQGQMVDITARKEAEEALAAEREQAAEQLRAALDTARDAANRLRALDSMKNAFLNAVSMELREPLASVLGSALTL